MTGEFEAYWAGRGKNLKQNMAKQRRKLEATLVPDEAFRGRGPVAPRVVPLSSMPAERPARLGLENVSSLEVRQFAPLEIVPIKSQRVPGWRRWHGDLLRIKKQDS